MASKRGGRVGGRGGPRQKAYQSHSVVSLGDDIAGCICQGQGNPQQPSPKAGQEGLVAALQLPNDLQHQQAAC